MRCGAQTRIQITRLRVVTGLGRSADLASDARRHLLATYPHLTCILPPHECAEDESANSEGYEADVEKGRGIREMA